VTLPLAAASARLRKRPGRPRKILTPEAQAAHDAVQRDRQQERLAASPRRLLDVAQAALYLGVSTWTVRDLIAAGRLPIVRLPVERRPNGELRELRRLLVDVRDCDTLIEHSKDRA
jgi:excisionase family DNA binding protein